MGTSNFYNTNAKKIYAVTGNDEFLWEDTRANIACELEDAKGVLFYESDSISLNEELRSFPATSIGVVEGYCVDYCGFSVRIEFVPKTVCGYHEGFSLDYEMSITVNGLNFFDENLSNEDEVVDGILEYGSPRQQALMNRWGANFKKLIENEIDRVTDIIENIYKNHSDCLTVSGVFSNGETVYKKCMAA